jgi:hypothetical protein
MTTVPTRAPELTRHLRPVPVGRLLRVHLTIWRAHRGVVVGTLLVLAVGLAGVLIGLSGHRDAYTTAGFGRQFISSTAAYAALWLAVGAVAGAAPFRNRWAALVLVVAPRRLRWLSASFASVIGWALGATVLLGVSASVLAAGVLAARGQDPAAAAGALTYFVPVVAATLLHAGVGFLLGAAARGVTVPLVLGYVVAPATPLLSTLGVPGDRWIDLDGAVAAAAGRFSPPVAAALCLWVSVPALIASWRLRRSSLS